MAMKEMKLKLTLQIDGNAIETIAESNDFDELTQALFAWKQANVNKYKVEPYNRMIFKKDDGKVIIDFGDYVYFLLIDGITDWSVIEKHLCPDKKSS